VLAFDSARYVGARIGIHDPSGRKVGRVSHLRNTEYMVLAGPRARVRTMVAAVESTGLGARVDRPVPVPAA
jgi:adenine-specific DNA-methyltransferase